MPAGSFPEIGNPQRILPFTKECVAHFTGSWPEGFRPRWKRRPWWHLVTTGLSLCGGVAASSLIAMAPPRLWPLLLLSWMFTVHGARKALLVICHYAVHGQMTGNNRLDRLLVEALSTVLIIQPFSGYYQDHIRTHHGPAFATLADPDAQFLLALGFQPGMSRDALWRHLYWTIVSPRFHAHFLWSRLKMNYIAAPLYRRLMAGGYAVAVVTCLVLTRTWCPWLMAWVVPLFLYHVVALLQFVSEHQWLHVHQPPPGMPHRRGPMALHHAHADKHMLCRLTFGRFVGDPLPSRDLPPGQWLWAWGWWLLRLLVLHIPTRMCVLPGGLCQHDWHHRHPRGDWANACYERRRDLTAGCPGWPEPYREVWGLGHAIDMVFAGLASLPPLPASTSLSRDVTDGACGMER
jgi:hypothetical protein